MDNGDGIAVGWLGHPIFRELEGLVLERRATPYLLSSCALSSFKKRLQE